jgi:hypothetical protein
MKIQLVSEVGKLDDIAITHNRWTSNNTESFCTVTSHYINEDWDMRSVVLETKKITGSHTAENIKTSLLETQNTWKLPVPTAVTDNATNDRKAFELLEWPRFGCYGQRINLMVKNALAPPELSKIIAKGRKLLLDDKQKGHKLIMDCATPITCSRDYWSRHQQ